MKKKKNNWYESMLKAVGLVWMGVFLSFLFGVEVKVFGFALLIVGCCVFAYEIYKGRKNGTKRTRTTS